jgi:hypothetical protein
VCLLLFGDNQENLIKVDLGDFADSPVSRSLTVQCGAGEAVRFQREEQSHKFGEGAFDTDRRCSLSIWIQLNKQTSSCALLPLVSRVHLFQNRDQTSPCAAAVLVCKCQNRKDVYLSEAGS